MLSNEKSYLCCLISQIGCPTLPLDGVLCSLIPLLNSHLGYNDVRNYLAIARTYFVARLILAARIRNKFDMLEVADFRSHARRYCVFVFST